MLSLASHSPFVFEAQDLAQAQIRRQGSESRIRALGGNLETPVVSRQELFQYSLRLLHGGCSGQPEFRDEPVLEDSRGTFHPSFGLGRKGGNHLYTQFFHCPSELGRHPREAGAGRVPEDPVPVGVEGDGCAEMLHETLDQQEVTVSVLLLAEEGVDHRTGGIVHCDQQRERRRLVPSHGWWLPSIWISMPSRGMRWRRTRWQGGRLRRGLLSPALTRMRGRVDMAYAYKPLHDPGLPHSILNTLLSLDCARKGGVIGITAVPNRLSNDPEQSIECVLDHYEYMVNLVEVDDVSIGTDTSIGDIGGVGQVVMGRTDLAPAPYLNGLESPADGKNIVRGLTARGHSGEGAAVSPFKPYRLSRVALEQRACPSGKTW